MIGTALTFEDGSQAVIMSRVGDDFFVHNAETGAGFDVLAADVKADPTRAASPTDVTAIIRSYQDAAGDRNRARATQALTTSRSSFGLEPTALSEPERAVILARLNNSRPREPLPAWIDDTIRAMQNEAPRPHDPVPAAFADRTPMPAATQAPILARLNPKAATNRAATSHDATVREHVIRRRSGAGAPAVDMPRKGLGTARLRSGTFVGPGEAHGGGRGASAVLLRLIPSCSRTRTGPAEWRSGASPPLHGSWETPAVSTCALSGLSSQRFQ